MHLHSNRKLYGCWAIVGAVVLGWFVYPSQAQVTQAQLSNLPAQNQGRQLNLHDQLVYGLKAFTKSDFAFIDSVVLQVRKGKLPERLVNGTFLWSRERAARKSRTRELRPMVYFRPALTMQAKRIGVKI